MTNSQTDSVTPLRVLSGDGISTAVLPREPLALLDAVNFALPCQESSFLILLVLHQALLPPMGSESRFLQRGVPDTPMVVLSGLLTPRGLDAIRPLDQVSIKGPAREGD
jgi:hypothetical protein